MLILTMANEPSINGFLRKRFHAKEIFTVESAIDLLQDYDTQAIILSEFTGTEEAILGAVAAIRKESPIKIIFIGREISESLGKTLLRAGVLLLEGDFEEDHLVALVEQYYNKDAVRRFAEAKSDTSESIGSSVIRQRIISFIGAPGAGKSLISNSLARTIAQSGIKTIMVDVSNFPMQHVYFSIRDKYVTKNITLYGINSASKLKHHTVEVSSNLHLLPGAVTTWGEPKVSSPRMAKLIDELKDNYDVIIFDGSTFINEITTDDAVKKSRDVFMVTTADLPGLHNATRLYPFVPAGTYWLQNRFMSLDLHNLYMSLIKRKAPVIRIPEISSFDLASSIAKGKPHPVMMKYAGEIATKILGITRSEKSGSLPKFLQRRPESAKASN